MLIRSNSFSRHAGIICALAISMASSIAMAAAPGTAGKSDADIGARYRSDVALCNSGQSNQSKADCIREAGAAQDEARRNRLGNGNQAFDKNEVARCQALPATERDECMLQMSGKNTTTDGSVNTTTEGSVGAGGVLRETTITTPGK